MNLDAKKTRSCNFSRAETQLLLRLSLKKKNILENKTTDSVNNRMKEKTWKDIASEFNASSAGPPRDWSSLKGKYNDIKRQMRKKKKSHMQTGGGPPSPPSPTMTEEEKELKLAIALSCDGLQPSQFDSDANYAQGFSLDQVEEMVVEELVDADDWSSYSPNLLKTPHHPLLQPEAETARLQPEAETAPLQPEAERPQRLIGSPPPRITPAESEPATSRRRPVLKRKSKASASSKFEELAEKKLYTYKLKESTAKINNIIAKLNLRIAVTKAKDYLPAEEIKELTNEVD